MQEMAATETLELKDVFQRIRSATKELLQDGAPPHEVSFALTYIAAELGFALAPDPLCVIPVIMQAVSEAAQKQLESSKAQSEKDCIEQEVAPGETIH